MWKARLFLLFGEECTVRVDVDQPQSGTTSRNKASRCLKGLALDGHVPGPFCRLWPDHRMLAWSRPTTSCPPRTPPNLKMSPPSSTYQERQIGFRRTIESSTPGKAFPLVASLLHFAPLPSPRVVAQLVHPGKQRGDPVLDFRGKAGSKKPNCNR